MRSSRTCSRPDVADSTVCSRAFSPRPNAFLVMVDDLLCQVTITGGSPAIGVIKENRLAETWRLGQANIARYHRGENLATEEISQIVADLVREIGSLVEHGEEDSLHRQVPVVVAPDANQRVEKLGDPLQREVLALHRHDNGVRRYQRVQGEQVKGWRTVKEDVVKLVAEPLHPFAQGLFAVGAVHKLDRRSNQVLVRRDEVESLKLALQDEFPKRRLEHKRMVQGPARRVFGEAQTSGGVGLGVGIHDQCPHVAAGKRSPQVDGSRRLSDTALLIGNCDDSSQRFQPEESQGESIKGREVMQVKRALCSVPIRL